jgi:tetratricopeptide (TPR) repeat protein
LVRGQSEYHGARNGIHCCSFCLDRESFPGEFKFGCKGCHYIVYCSEQCRREDWSFRHSKLCDDYKNKQSQNKQNKKNKKQNTFEEKKQEGNKYYQSKKFKEAITSYTEALKLAENESNEIRAILYNNRSLSYQQLNQYEEAYNDAVVAVQTNPTSKGYYSLAKSLFHLHRYIEALEIISTQVESDSNAFDTLKLNILKEYRNYQAVNTHLLTQSQVIPIPKYEFNSSSVIPFDLNTAGVFTCYSKKKRKMIFTGGIVDRGIEIKNDVYEYDPFNPKWTRVYHSDPYSYDSDDDSDDNDEEDEDEEEYNVPIYKNITRSQHSSRIFTHDTDADIIYAYGGFAVYKYDIALREWTLVKCRGGKIPYPRSLATFVYSQNKLYLFGGGMTFNGEYVDRTKELYYEWDYSHICVFDLQTRRWTELTTDTLSGICSDLNRQYIHQHNMCVRPDTQNLLIFGVTPNQRGLFEFNIETRVWSELQTKGPTPQVTLSPEICVTKDKLYLFSGLIREGEAFRVIDELYELSFPDLTWTKINVEYPLNFMIPHKRRITSGMTYMEHRNSLILTAGVVPGQTNEERMKRGGILSGQLLSNYNQVMEEIFLSKMSGTKLPQQLYQMKQCFSDITVVCTE